jgi:hypothetical protein
MSDEWAGFLVRRIITRGARGPTVDRELLPAILQNWSIDITALRTSSGAPPWEEFQKPGGLADQRNKYIHEGKDVEASVAALGIECADRFLRDVVDPLADRLGFTRGQTHVWSTINPVPPRSLEPEAQRLYVELNKPTEYKRSSPFDS